MILVCLFLLGISMQSLGSFELAANIFLHMQARYFETEAYLLGLELVLLLPALNRGGSSIYLWLHQLYTIPHAILSFVEGIRSLSCMREKQIKEVKNIICA